MSPRLHALFFALAIALLIVLGTFGIFRAEASSFQAIVADPEITSQPMTPDDSYDRYDYDAENPPIPGLPGRPY